MTVSLAIANAEALLPGVPAPDSEIDPRWQAIIEVAEYIESDPGQVWAFARKWASHEQEDLQTAIATCVLEHLLEHDFPAYFPLMAAQAKTHPTFARALSIVWLAEHDAQSTERQQLHQLLASLRSQ